MGSMLIGREGVMGDVIVVGVVQKDSQLCRFALNPSCKPSAGRFQTHNVCNVQ